MHTMKIKVKGSSLVKPATDTPRGTILNSNLDHVSPFAYSLCVFFYRPPEESSFDYASTIRDALSRVLVHFYPLAGRLKLGEGGRNEIDCTAIGALFVEAEADGVLDYFGNFAPSSELRCLIPTVNTDHGNYIFPVFMAQVTRFQCGGVSLGLRTHHHIVDGHGALHFINTWSDIARGLPVKLPPIIKRTLLPRDPPQPQFKHIEYRPTTPITTASPETVYSLFKLTKPQIDSLKAKANIKGLTFSSYEILAAHIWRCVCQARALPETQTVNLYVATDGRSRLQPPMPPGFFGNAVFLATPTAASGELVGNPVSYAARKIHDAIKGMNDEYLRSAIDYLELQPDLMALVRDKHKYPNISITSWVRLPMYDVDFGWGKPIYAGPAVPPIEGKCYVVRDINDGGGLIIAIALQEQHMKVFEKLVHEI